MARFPERQVPRTPYSTIKKIAAYAGIYWANALFHAERGLKITQDTRDGRLGCA
jgi:hypothetical protein